MTTAEGLTKLRTLYSTGFDDFATQWATNPAAPESQRTMWTARALYELLRVLEGMIVAPAVCNHVYGANYALPAMLDAVGIRGTEELLEEGALQFLLWRPTVGYVVPSPKVAGLDPLASGNAGDPTHSDPEASIADGLRRWGQRHAAQDLRRVSRLAADATHLPASNVAHNAVEVVRRAYDRGMLEGYPSGVPRYELEEAARATLSKVAEDVARGMVLYDLDLNLHESRPTWDQLLRLREVVAAPSVARSVDEGLRLENLPSIPMALASGALDPRGVLALRRSPETQEFRRWLWGRPDPRDASEVGRAWASAMQVRFIDNGWFKAVRLTTFSLVGAGVGAALGNFEDAAIGLAAGVGSNLAVGVADSIGLEAVLKRPGPVRFGQLLRRNLAARGGGLPPADPAEDPAFVACIKTAHRIADAAARR